MLLCGRGPLGCGLGVNFLVPFCLFCARKLDLKLLSTSLRPYGLTQGL